MNVLSLFDGMSCGMIALERSGINVDNYFASEVDKYAIKVSEKNYPSIKQIGNVLDYEQWNLPEIDLLIGGSPCQDLSRIKSKDGKGLDGEKSKLFYTYFHALLKFKPKYFLLENVVMAKEYEDIITKLLGVEPILLDSGDFSAQNRPRLYWTNINFDKSKKNSNLKIHHIMELGKIEEKYYIKDPYKWHGMKNKIVANLNTHDENGKRKYMDTTSRVYNINHKSPALTAVCGGGQHKKIYDGVGIRRLTPLEYERLQTVPDGYTDCVSDSQRYKMLGNGWTVDVIAHIFEGLKESN